MIARLLTASPRRSAWPRREPLSEPLWALFLASHASLGRRFWTRVRHMRRFTGHPVCGTNPRSPWIIGCWPARQVLEGRWAERSRTLWYTPGISVDPDRGSRRMVGLDPKLGIGVLVASPTRVGISHRAVDSRGADLPMGAPANESSGALAANGPSMARLVPARALMARSGRSRGFGPPPP
jgi:hypothetical protein